MKKILFTLLLSIFLIPYVNADIVTKDILYQDFYTLNSVSDSSGCFPNMYYYNDFETFISDSNNRVIFNKLYNDIMTYYEENYKETLPYYALSVNLISTSSEKFLPLQIRLDIRAVDNSDYLYKQWASPTYNSEDFNVRYYMGNYYEVSTSGYIACDKTNPHNYGFVPLKSGYYTPLATFQTNHKSLILDENTTYNVTNKDGTISTYTSLIDYYPVYMPNGYDSSIYDTYTTVNLDNYEYVILNLKDYSKKEAFETNLQVKGSIGITPVYNYGQVEKSEVTDRCNLGYSDFTDYRFFILKNDLTNNAFYIVKACEESSSFRFDSNIFDITYVTTENVDDPVVTFGGVEYHTIPFNKLSNSANQNEQNNFIPGESGSSLTDIIDNISDFTSDIWNAISSFMGLVTKFFNTLPEEFRYLSITSFTVLAVIAIIKFIRG